MNPNVSSQYALHGSTSLGISSNIYGTYVQHSSQSPQRLHSTRLSHSKSKTQYTVTTDILRRETSNYILLFRTLWSLLILMEYQWIRKPGEIQKFFGRIDSSMLKEKYSFRTTTCHLVSVSDISIEVT